MQPSHFDSHLFASLLEQVETAALSAGGLKNISAWLCRNTRDPKNPNRDWSFAGHAFQRAILDDPNPDQSVVKCAQVGLSEILVRAALAATAKFAGSHFMYVLPTTGFSKKFSASRVDPVIDASPRLRRMLSPSVSNLELKKLGTSFLHIGGAAANSSAISVPARGLFVDERAFCDEGILSVLASRLAHNAAQESIIRRFSTPLFPGSDITADYEAGDMKQYLAWHPACGQWVMLSVLDDLVLPGYDADLRLLEPGDLDRLGVNIDEAWIKCPRCGGRCETEDLANPDYRAWVPMKPDASRSSFRVTPLALPQIRTPATLLKELRDVYKNRVTWLRFGLGEAAESGADQILKSVLNKAFCVRPGESVSGTVIGCDVGKTSHVVTGKGVDGKLHLLRLETLREDLTGNLLGAFRQQKAVQMVVDAAPDISTPRSLLAQLPEGQVWGCYFIRGAGASELTNYKTDIDQGVIKAYRTRVLDWFVELVNTGKILFPVGLPVGLEEEIKSHLMALKRIADRNASGEEAVKWVSTSTDDHWFFAVLYCALAWDLSAAQPSAPQVPASLKMVGRVRMRAA